MSLLARSRLLLTLTVATLALLPVPAIAQDDDFGPYSLKIVGKVVTEENKDDILGDSSVSFDPDTRTLTLNGANIVDNRTGTAIASQEELTVRAVGHNSIHVPGVRVPRGTRMYEADRIGITAESVTFDGDGSVDISIKEGGVIERSYAIAADAGGVTVAGATVTAISGGATAGHARGIKSRGSVIVNNGVLKTGNTLSTEGSSAIDTDGQFIVTGGVVEATGGRATTVHHYLPRGESIGIDTGGGIQITGGTITASGENYAFFAADHAIDIGQDLTVLVGQKQDGSDAVEWDRRSSFRDWQKPYRYVKVADGGVNPAPVEEPPLD